MIQQELKKMGRRQLIYTCSTEPEKYQITDEDGNIYDDAYDLTIKSYTEIERPVKETENKENETEGE